MFPTRRPCFVLTYEALTVTRRAGTSVAHKHTTMTIRTGSITVDRRIGPCVPYSTRGPGSTKHGFHIGLFINSPALHTCLFFKFFTSDSSSSRQPRNSPLSLASRGPCPSWVDRCILLRWWSSNNKDARPRIVYGPLCRTDSEL